MVTPECKSCCIPSSFQFLLRYNLIKVLTRKMPKPINTWLGMSLKYVYWIRYRTFWHSKGFPHAPIWVILHPKVTKYWFLSSHNSFACLNIHINGITQQVLFCIWIFTQCLWYSSVCVLDKCVILLYCCAVIHHVNTSQCLYYCWWTNGSL